MIPGDASLLQVRGAFHGSPRHLPTPGTLGAWTTETKWCCEKPDALAWAKERGLSRPGVACDVQLGVRCQQEAQSLQASDGGRA